MRNVAAGLLLLFKAKLCRLSSPFEPELLIQTIYNQKIMADGIGDIEMKRCIVGIRRPGESEVAANGKNVPTIWFPSMATMAAVLSEDNRALLRIIRDAKPKTLTNWLRYPGDRCQTCRAPCE